MVTRHYNADVDRDPEKRYASDLSDQEFAILAPLVAQKSGSGKQRTVNIREILNAIFYRLRTGCQWRMLPTDFPAWNHVW
jgi:putative transposase